MQNDKYVDILEVFKSEQGWWHYRAKSSNGEILFSSEGFSHESYAIQVAEALAADLSAKVKVL